MSKIKDQMLKDQDYLLEYESKYYEWIESQKVNELSESDINRLEREQKSPQSVCPSIISQQANNQFYIKGKSHENY